MTIIFLARRFYPLIGGVEKHVFEISKRLIKKGHRVIVITEQSSNHPNYEKLKTSGIEIYRLAINRQNPNKFEIWKEIWKLKEIIKESDIVHCHDVFFWYLPLRFIFPNKKVFTTFHGYESYPITKKAIRMRKVSEKLSMGNICIGDFIPKWYGTKPTFVSYGAVDIQSELQKTKVRKDSALFIGRLDDQTGILTYDVAIRKIHKYYPNFNFCVIGDGEYKSHLDKKTKVLGFQKNPEKYFSGYHFAFVSRYLAILEAFAAKRLVFAVYDNPVKEDYLKMSPFAKYMIVAETADELSEKIKFMLANPEVEKKLTHNAFEWSKKQTWDKVVQMYIKLWQV